jgi:hypothetical protein
MDDVKPVSTWSEFTIRVGFNGVTGFTLGPAIDTVAIIDGDFACPRSAAFAEANTALL